MPIDRCKRGNVTQTAYEISVIICAYTEDRWNDLLAAVASVQRQSLTPREIVIVIDHNPRLLERVREHLSGVILVENTQARGLRGARNCGIAVASSPLIAFLDDDAVAIPDWLMFLCEAYNDPQVFATGGSVTPLWVEQKPSWFPEEFYWVVGCTYRGMPQRDATIRNPIGANMSIRRDVFDTVGDFHSEIEAAGHAGGCEETELCIRAYQRWPQGKVLYCPNANVFHRVTSNRSSWHYFCSRCYAEGAAKAVLSQYLGAKNSLASERAYTLQTLPLGIVRGIKDGILRLDLAGFPRAGAILAGFVMTTSGYLAGSVSRHLVPFKRASSSDEQKVKELLRVNS